ncbi:MAG: ABC transporter substrate-binding protein, partial [Paenibacillaceae bacterium]
MRIRTMAMLLCALLLLLAACSGGGSSNNGNNDSTGSSGNETTVDTETGDEPVDETEDLDDDVYRTPEMDFDLGGKTIRIVSWWDMTIPEDNPDNIQRKQNLEELMAKHNFKVEYIAIDYGEYQQKVTASLLAGEPIGEIVRLGKTYTVPALVKQDLLWPIDEYTKNANAFNQKVTNEYYTYQGRGYGFSENHANLVQGIFYN